MTRNRTRPETGKRSVFYYLVLGTFQTKSRVLEGSKQKEEMAVSCIIPDRRQSPMLVQSTSVDQKPQETKRSIVKCQLIGDELLSLALFHTWRLIKDRRLLITLSDSLFDLV